MAIPYVQECNEAMSQVHTAAGNIRDAIDAIMEFANEDTWQGGKADDWMTDLEGFVGDARTSLGDPLDDAVQECRDNAQEWQAESASAGGG